MAAVKARVHASAKVPHGCSVVGFALATERQDHLFKIPTTLQQCCVLALDRHLTCRHDSSE